MHWPIDGFMQLPFERPVRCMLLLLLSSLFRKKEDPSTTVFLTIRYVLDRIPVDRIRNFEDVCHNVCT